MDLALLERLHDHQAVDEEPVALRRRNAAGRRVRARDVAQLLEVRHHVADRRRRQLEARLLRQHARADRLPVDDVALDERLQQMLGAGIQHADHFTDAGAESAADRPDAAPGPGATAPRLIRPVDFGPDDGCALIAAMTPHRPAPTAVATRAAAFQRVALIGRPRAPASPSRCRISRRSSPLGARRGARGGDGTIHAASRLPVRLRRSARHARRRRHRRRRRRHDAVDRAPARAVRRAADRHQPGPARLPHRHSARRHGSHARGDARRAATSRSAARCSPPRSCAPTARAKRRWR